MAKRRLSKSKPNRIRRIKAKRNRRPSMRSSTRALAPIDYAAMTEYSSPEESSMPSMLTMGIVLLMIAGLGFAWYITAKMWMDEDVTLSMLLGGTAVTKGAISSKAAGASMNNKYLAVVIASLMTLFVMVFVKKTFM